MFVRKRTQEARITKFNKYANQIDLMVQEIIMKDKEKE